ncbi:MAG: SDR family NAD(P)-dependent oxidoreductase [Paracoccaceae bacterium]|nr:SDR family NAD(P)-dependent oxidoreductase [Paracoccaceae bacterium]
MKRRALVTGGNRGIGKEIARGLVTEGLDVMIGVRDMDMGVEVAEDIGAKAALCDLASSVSLPPHARDVHVLVNNAGVLFEEPLFTPAARFDESVDVMLRAPYELIRATLPFMQREGYGRIVNVSSGWGSFAEGLGGPGAYGIAKAALNALTVAAAGEAGAGIKINAMCPGWVRTRMGGASANLSPEEGADTGIWLATLADDGPSGKFFRRRKEIDW